MIVEKDKLVGGREINELAKKYNVLDYSVNLASSLKGVFPSKNFNNFSKYELHKLLNDTLIQNHNGEEVLKYKLFKSFANRQNIIAAFEIKVKNSRVDFLTLNGNTTSFEIKSKLDNLSKLSKQMADYMLAFEFNYLVIDEKHIEKARELLPKSFGLWCYKKGKYQKMKKALLNDKIDPEIQLQLLTKRELVNGFPKVGGEQKSILKTFDADSINRKFKETLKARYRTRWNFIVENEAQIFPIDIQFFFNTNIQPTHIYNH